MVIKVEYSSETEFVDGVNAQYGSFDDKNYVSIEDENDANNNMTQKTRTTEAMEITNLHYDDIIQYKQNYLVAIDNKYLNQETQETSVSNKTAEYGNENYVSIEDDNDANNMTQKTRTTEAMEITNLHHNDIKQFNQTRKCQVQNHTYVVPIDNTILNPRTSVTPRTSVSRQT